MKKLSIIAIILSTLTLSVQIFIFATDKSDEDAIYTQALKNDYRIYSPVLPDTLKFAGEKVPLDVYYVREGLDREILSNMYWHTNTILNMKRAYRFFPVIEPILKRHNIPDDFKYLCVIESNLMNVTSPAKAQGYWQFIKATGKKYGLEISEEIDMRNSLEASTEAACKFLKALYNQFGSWTLAAAAYNCGENGLQRQLNLQEVDNYYDLRLNSETARYVYRIMAMKLIMQNPQDYGFHLRYKDMYPQLPYRTAELKGQNVDLYQFAKEHNTTYKMLREMNPWIITNKLTNKANKTYTVRLPIENGTLLKNIRKDKDKQSTLVRFQ
ncbi:MAG: lytic transglycosylase domain-containing protein [Bacteroidales bacterium]|nr:lytic transglycosylase domain-containing protein [Bacteroidales bacterium]